MAEQRKLVQHGENTLTISIPSDWVRDMKLAKGDTVVVSPCEGGLFVSAPAARSTEDREISVRGLTHSVESIIVGLYIGGVRRVLIAHDGHEQAAMIRQIVRRKCRGFDVVERGERTLTLQSVSEMNAREINSVVRRLFLLMLSFADHLRAVHLSDGAKDLCREDCEDIERTSNLCMRTISLQFMNFSGRASALLEICALIKRMGVLLMKVYVHIAESKQSPEIMRICDGFAGVLSELIPLFAEDDPSRMERVYVEIARLERECEGLLGEQGASLAFLLHSGFASLRQIIGAIGRSHESKYLA